MMFGFMLPVSCGFPFRNAIPVFRNDLIVHLIVHLIESLIERLIERPHGTTDEALD